MRHSFNRLVDVTAVLATVSAVALIILMLTRSSSFSHLATDPTAVFVEDWASYAEAGQRLGSRDAAITIVEFGDYQCRYCREAEPHLAAIMREYGVEVALVYRHYPLVIESASYTAARAAECAGEQGLFWPFHRRLFSSRDWQVGDTKDALKRLGMEIGVADPIDFDTCVESETPVREIAADLEAAADLGISGTPAFLVNGRLSMGVLDSLSFADIYRQARR